MSRRPDWETLSAYVDGELDAQAAGRVAEAAGREPAVAAEIAALYRLKGLAGAAGVPPPPDLVAGIGRPKPPLWRTALLAGAAAAVLGLGFWVAWPPGNPPGLPPAAVQTARELHEKWLEAGAARDVPAARMLAALSDFGRMPSIPDLTGTGLTVGFVDSAKRAGGNVLQVGYRGKHGCHLSMFVFRDAGLAETPTEMASGKILAYGWQARDLDYLLFAEGMDRNRFDLIGREVEAATRRGRPLDERDQLRLAENKRESAACRA